MVEPTDLEIVARQLGREPRGVLEIAYRCPDGDPAVVKTAPKLPDGTPFPTLYYLTHPALTAAASRLESSGLMREMTQRGGTEYWSPPPILKKPNRSNRYWLALVSNGSSSSTTGRCH